MAINRSTGIVEDWLRYTPSINRSCVSPREIKRQVHEHLLIKEVLTETDRLKNQLIKEFLMNVNWDELVFDPDKEDLD